MALCECIEKCPFFHDKLSGMPAMANMMKKQYCENEFERCARFRIREALGPGKVPGDVFPNDLAKVEGIVKAAQAGVAAA